MRFPLYNFALPLLLLAACATVVPPSGGPEDKLPPRVAGIAPAPGAVAQNTQLDVTLQFDEWINSSIPRSAVSISPPIEKKLRFDVDGDRLHIYSSSPLDTLTTYTLTISNGLKDLQGNSIAKPFQLVFSTGPVLDSLQVSGRVLVPDSLQRQKFFPAVGLFPLGADRAERRYLKRFRDSLELASADTLPRLHREPPLYLTHADSLGNFRFQGLRPGLYQVAAFADLNGNQRIEFQSELAGVAEQLLRLDSVAAPLWLTLGDQDTAALRLEGISQRGNSQIEVAFSRPPVLDSAFLDSGNCVVTRKGNPAPLKSSGYYTEALSGNLVLVVDSLQADSTYQVACRAATDSLGRKLDARQANAELRWEKMTDTVSTRVSLVTPSRGARSVWTDEAIVVAYNRPVHSDSLAPHFILQVNADTVPAIVNQRDAVRLEIRTTGAWSPDATVRLSYLKPDTLEQAGSELLAQFETVAKLKMASLTGTVPGGTALTRIRLRSVERKDEVRTARCDAKGTFKITGLLEGFYVVDYFHDLDGNGLPSPGRLFPLRAGEPWRAPVNELILPHGDDNILEKLLPELPRLPSPPETP